MFDEIFNLEQMQELQKILRRNKQTLTCAESCTGGLIASMITEISGSSDVFEGSIVSYSNRIKYEKLNVSKDDLEKFGPVSKEVVFSMCIGALETFDSDYAIAVSGIAGPNGATKEKAVGTVIIGIISKQNHKEIEQYNLKGSRKEIQIQCAKLAFRNLLNLLKSLDK